MTTTTAPRNRRIRDPLLADVLLAVGLALLTAAQIWGFSNFGPHGAPGGPFRVPMPPPDTALAYALAIAAFLSLAVRRRLPWLALALSGTFAVTYDVLRLPPAFVTLAPMIALYTLASRAPRRSVGMIAMVGGAVVIAAAALAFTEERWLIDAARTFVLLGTAAFLGENARSRRQYIAEVEQRAYEAERTREEEARRRVDEERLRIAREVHDVVAHSLSIVAVQAAAADALVEGDPERAHESIAHIRTTAKQALSELRSMLGVLRTGEDAPLAPAADLTRLSALVAQVREAGVEVALNVEGDLAGVPAVASVSAFRIVQEALTNVVRHAHADTAVVHVAVNGSRVVLDILDEGAGATNADLARGHGLRGMHERAEALGGTLTVGPRTDGPGFAVHAELPVLRSA